jgi:hypothetical protein
MSTNEAAASKSGVFDPKANIKAVVRIIAILAFIAMGLWLFLRFTAGPRAANLVAATVLRQPIEITNGVQNVPAAHREWMPITLTYGGLLTIDSTVLKGNPLDVHLAPADQIDNIKNMRPYRCLTAFDALKSKFYKRSVQLQQGTYYLVFQDSSLGILSAQSTDVRVHAKLEP